jgi:uncharacterized repeat protein (TIGR01451 family)
MKRTIRGLWALRMAALTALVLAAGWAGPLAAQWPTGAPANASHLPTRAGTDIVNIATATFTDANTNVYLAVADTVTVEVAFVPEFTVALIGTTPSVVTGDATYTYYFQITNLGNDTDWPVLSDPVAGQTHLSNFEYCYKPYEYDQTTPKSGTPEAGHCFATLAGLQADLNLNPLDIHEYLILSIRVTVADDQGGETQTITVGVESGKEPGQGGNSEELDLYIGEVDVEATAKTIDRLPSNTTQYSAEFTVTNQQVEGNKTYNLLAVIEGTNQAGLSIVRTALCAAPLADIEEVTIAAPGGDAKVCVIYTVAFNADALTGTIRLTATDASYAGITDYDDHVVTIVRPALQITKKAYRDSSGSMGSTEILDMETVVPGEFFWYEIKVSNQGSAEAATVSIVDNLPMAYLFYVSHGGDTPPDGAPAWNFEGTATASGQIRAALATLTSTHGVRYIRIRVQVK